MSWYLWFTVYDSPVEEYRDKMTDWGLPLSQYSQQCQACFAPQSGSGLDIVENTEQGRQANQYRYPRPERRYSVFRNQGTVAPEYSTQITHFHIVTRQIDFSSRIRKNIMIRTKGYHGPVILIAEHVTVITKDSITLLSQQPANFEDFTTVIRSRPALHGAYQNWLLSK